MKTGTNLLNSSLCYRTYPTGPAARTSLSGSKPLITTYTPFPSPPITFAAKFLGNKMKKKGKLCFLFHYCPKSLQSF